MRRLSIPAVLILLMGLAIPAWAKPSASHVVQWTIGGGTITLDTSTGLIQLDVLDRMTVECFGASAEAIVELSGSAIADFSIDAQGRSGSFSVDSDQLTISVSSVCGDLSATSISGAFETDKGKADDRRKEGSDRIIERSGSGSLTAGLVLMENADVAVVTTISR